MNFSQYGKSLILLFVGILFFPFTDNAIAVSLKDTVIDEIDTSGTGYYGRLLVSEDFNNDGTKELVYIKLSPSYMNYVWSSHGKGKRNDKDYNQRGIELSKSPEWFASFLPSKMKGNKPVKKSTQWSTPHTRVGSWEAKFNGDLGCVHPSQIIPAHLNEDTFLDFVIPCHGYDTPPFPGEHSLVLLSDGPNNYNVTQLTDQPGFYHDGATSDFNGDGKIDILLVDSNAKKLRVLLNKGDGNFQLSNKYFPQFSSWKGAYTTEILDVNDDGFFDIFVAGHEEDKHGSQPTVFLLGNKNNKFSNSKKLVIPKIKGYGIVLDVIKEGKNLFVLRTGSGNRAYKGAAIQNVSIENLTTINVLKRDNVRALSRIFRKADETGRLKFGSLTNKDSAMDFVFDGKEIQLNN